jgi:hypothetical protein
VKLRKVLRKIVVLCLIGICVTLTHTAPALAQDPLPSWNKGPAKQAIVEFVCATTDKARPKFVPPAERITTLDQDATLWVSHPF